MVLAGLRYLAAADPTALAAQAQAECLQSLEQADAITAAARARILAAFTAGQGYADDADYSPASWLIHRTKVTKGAARGHLGWARRAAAHPQVVAALAEGTVLTESMARTICGWTDKLPANCQEAADEILVTAARHGARQYDLAGLAAEIYARSLPDQQDASFLRTRQLGARLSGPSLPLDVGRSAEIPAAIRRAVILRDQHCRWAGGCDQPASACEVHHVTHLADGGTTSVDGCALYCFFHHHVAIHQWGWTVTLNPDGTTTARSPDGTKIFHSHSPPARAG